MIRDLTEVAVGMVKQELRKQVEVPAKERVAERLVDLLVPKALTGRPRISEEAQRHTRTRDKMRAKLDAGELEEKMVEWPSNKSWCRCKFLSNMGMENMDVDLQNMFERILPKQNQQRQMPVREARRVLLELESEALIDKAVVTEKAVELVENEGIVFLDELDKVCGPSSGHGPDVSRQGVQRDLLPVVEGTTVNTKHGPVRTDHILFIAAGAFHTSKPADLMPELQGRFPIRVELSDLTRDDFLRHPDGATALVDPAICRVIEGRGPSRWNSLKTASQPWPTSPSRSTARPPNIGARRLHTILERVVEEISYLAPDQLPDMSVTVDGAYVRGRLDGILQKADLSRSSCKKLNHETHERHENSQAMRCLAFFVSFGVRGSIRSR